MNPESWQHLEQPIEVEDPKARERELSEKLDELQLRYAEMKWETSGEKDRPAFTELLERSTTLLADVRQAARRMRPDADDESIERELAPLREEIEALHVKKGEGWETRILERLRAVKEAYGPEPERGEIEQIPSENFGLLKFNMKEQKGLEAYGIGTGDPCLEVHVERAFMKQGAKVAPKALKESFSRLAEAIVDQYPHAKAIVGYSWLLDTPLAKRLGFTVPEDVESPQVGMSVWYQFIDKNGQVDAKKVQELFEKGEPPHRARLGFIPAEEFLRRYLPAERRGREVVLKDVTPEWKEHRRAITEEAKRLRTAWAGMKAENVERELDAMPELAAAFEKIGVKDRFIELARKAKSAGFDWEGLKAMPGFKEIGAALDRHIAQDMYVEKRVFIP